MANPKVPQIFSQKRRRASFRRALQRAQSGRASDWLIDEICQDIEERANFMQLAPQKCLAIGLGMEKIRINHAVVEITAEIDEELPIEGGPYDLIISCNRLGTVNDLPGALIHMRRALADGGLAIASLVGAGSLPLLRKIMMAADGERPAARIHPQIDNRAGSALLERAGFARQVVDNVRLRASYTSFDRMIADLREQGLTNVLSDPPPPLGKADLRRAREEFDRHRDGDGRVTETFEILTLTGWA